MRNLSDKLLVTEIFHSIQGETSLSGIPFIFIRLTGCNLRCHYCDTSYAFKGKNLMSFEEVFQAIEKYPARHVLLTGGEPLLQRPIYAFIQKLLERKYKVSIETHGEASLETLPPEVRIIMDIKTPGSGVDATEWKRNLRYLKPQDEIKFVITSATDYEWAKSIVRNGNLPDCEILFSPAFAAANCPGTIEGIEAKVLAEKILGDGLPVRLQLQLHKLLWGAHSQGV